MTTRKGEQRSAGRAGATVALLVVTTLTACLLPGEAGSGGPPTPTPIPSFHDSARRICAAHAPAIRDLADQLADVTDANLVEQGTVVATLAGIVSTEVVQLRSILLEPVTSDREAVAAWFAELDATADAQVRAVAASAVRDVGAFRTAFDASVAHWDAAGTQAAAVRLRSCHPVSLAPRP